MTRSGISGAGQIIPGGTTSLAGRPPRHKAGRGAGPIWSRLLTLVLAVAALWLLGGEFYIRLKAVVAGDLIERALSAHLNDGQPHPPWGWADHHPLARLEIPRLGASRPILSNATGSALAFGAGHLDGTSGIGHPGNCVLAGHRDGAFAILKSLRVEDSLNLQTADGSFIYRVSEILVVDKGDTWILEPTPDDILTLITCFPFHSPVRGPNRYVVICERGEIF